MTHVTAVVFLLAAAYAQVNAQHFIASRRRLWGLRTFLAALGIALGWLVTVTFPLPPIRYHGRPRPLGILRLGLVTLRDLAVASWRLTLAAFVPRIDFHPAVIRVPLRSNQDLYQVETAELISIVPGSIVIDARRSTRMLYLHLVDVSGPDGVEESRHNALEVERRVLEAIASDAELAALRRKAAASGGSASDGPSEGSASDGEGKT